MKCVKSERDCLLMLCLHCSANADLGDTNPVMKLEILLSMLYCRFYRVYNFVNQKHGVRRTFIEVFWGVYLSLAIEIAH